jgi:predicted RNase H-like nuclease (RuvC/YqgF family)
LLEKETKSKQATIETLTARLTDTTERLTQLSSDLMMTKKFNSGADAASEDRLRTLRLERGRSIIYCCSHIDTISLTFLFT